MADWKYVVFQANDQKLPIIFPNDLIHKDVADAVHRAIRQHVIQAQPDNWISKPVSAGFLSGMVVTGVHGRSESMDLRRDEHDRALINTFPYCFGRQDGMPVAESLVIEAVKRNLP